jgi:hypothetical protein
MPRAFLSILRGSAMLVLLAPAVARGQEVILQNDSFMSGQIAGFQGGFVAGEIGASRLIPPGPFPMQITKVQFLFGGLAGDRTIRLHIWDDAAGTSMPGIGLFVGDYLVTAANNALQEIDLVAEQIMVTGPFRVGIEFTHNGLPSIARDNDGIAAGRNFILAQGLGWFDSTIFGLTGDWIIRAGVTPPATAVDPTPAPPALALRAHPNPFNPHTTLRFELAEPATVRLDVFAVDGRRIRTLAAGALPAGPHFEIWDGRDDRGHAVASGSYVARLRAGPAVRTFRMTLAR